MTTPSFMQSAESSRTALARSDNLGAFAQTFRMADMGRDIHSERRFAKGLAIRD
jgi:hypothetical protein